MRKSDPAAADALVLDAPGLLGEPIRSGLRAGLTAPFRGVSFLLHRRDLWPLAAVPALVAIVAASSLGAASVAFLPRLVARVIGPTSSTAAQFGATLATVGVTVLGLALSILLALTLAQPLSGPALERLARAMEQHLGVPDRPQVPLWRQLGRSAGGVLVGLCCGLPLLVLLLLVTLVFPAAGVVTLPLKLLVLGMMVTWDLMDYPFTVRGWGLLRRARWMQDHFSAVMGFGISLGIVLLIPCVHVLLLPTGAVGATWLYHERSRVKMLKAK